MKITAKIHIEFLDNAHETFQINAGEMTLSLEDRGIHEYMEPLTGMIHAAGSENYTHFTLSGEIADFVQVGAPRKKP